MRHILYLNLLQVLFIIAGSTASFAVTPVWQDKAHNDYYSPEEVYLIFSYSDGRPNLSKEIFCSNSLARFHEVLGDKVRVECIPRYPQMLKNYKNLLVYVDVRNLSSQKAFLVIVSTERVAAGPGDQRPRYSLREGITFRLINTNSNVEKQVYKIVDEEILSITNSIKSSLGKK